MIDGIRSNTTVDFQVIKDGKTVTSTAPDKEKIEKPESDRVEISPSKEGEQGKRTDKKVDDKPVNKKDDNRNKAKKEGEAAAERDFREGYETRLAELQKQRSGGNTGASGGTAQVALGNLLGPEFIQLLSEILGGGQSQATEPQLQAVG